MNWKSLLSFSLRFGGWSAVSSRVSPPPPGPRAQIDKIDKHLYFAITTYKQYRLSKSTLPTLRPVTLYFCRLPGFISLDFWSLTDFWLRLTLFYLRVRLSQNSGVVNLAVTGTGTSTSVSVSWRRRRKDARHFCYGWTPDPVSAFSFSI